MAARVAASDRDQDVLRLDHCHYIVDRVSRLWPGAVVREFEHIRPGIFTPLPQTSPSFASSVASQQYSIACMIDRHDDGALVDELFPTALEQVRAGRMQESHLGLGRQLNDSLGVRVNSDCPPAQQTS